MRDIPEDLRSNLAGRYSLERVVGYGGMATVYLARDIKHNRQVAVKVLKPELVATLGVDRFLREIEISARLNHPHILPLLDSGDADGTLYYVMPFVDGESLRSLLNRERPLSQTRAQAILKEVADALSYAHRQGLVHRDIKPENILLSEGHAVVADFGIAKALSTAGGEALTRTGFPLGTPGYMSPEQAAGNTDLDERTDVFSLACVFYEMVVGDTPSLWPVEEEVKLGRFTDLKPEHRERLDALSGHIEQALTRAMAQRPRERFPTPLAFAEAMEHGSKDARRYGDAEARSIIRRAAEMQASADNDGDAISIGRVQQIAAEVGIPPDKVRVAADLVHDEARTIPHPGFSTSVSLESTVDQELPEARYEAVLEEIRSSLGEVGRINPTLGKSLSWNSLTFQNSLEGTGRLTHVMINPRSGKTRIRITESAGVHSVIAVTGVALVGIATLAILKQATGLPGPIVASGVGAALLASGTGARVLLRMFHRHRQRVLSRLLNRLSGLVMEEEQRVPSHSTRER